MDTKHNRRWHPTETTDMVGKMTEERFPRVAKDWIPPERREGRLDDCGERYNVMIKTKNLENG